MSASASPVARCLAAFVVCLISFSGWAETFEETKELAEQGDADAQYNLGMMFYDGNGVHHHPFRGKVQRIPGVVEAEHYDEGPAGIAYLDVDKENRELPIDRIRRLTSKSDRMLQMDMELAGYEPANGSLHRRY